MRVEGQAAGWRGDYKQFRPPHDGLQLPLAQISVVPHGAAHAPQLLLSVFVFTQAPPQHALDPAGQAAPQAAPLLTQPVESWFPGRHELPEQQPPHVVLLQPWAVAAFQLL
jgi:hypothetical protein